MTIRQTLHDLVLISIVPLIQYGYQYLPFFQKKNEKIDKDLSLFIHKSQEELQVKVKQIENTISLISSDNHRLEVLSQAQIASYNALKENIFDIKDRMEKSYANLDAKIDALKNIMLQK